MKDLTNYPVTFGYKQYWGSYLHRGEDRAAPTGTPIIINGVKIGEVGSTGKSTGPHSHLQVGRDQWAQNTIKPSNYWFKGDRVVRTGTASEWGNYVIVQYKDVYCVYAHLSKITTEAGVSLKESDMLFRNAGTTRRVLISEVLGRNRTQAHKDKWTEAFTKQYGHKTFREVTQIFWSSKEAQNYRAKKDRAFKALEQLPDVRQQRDQYRKDAKAANQKVDKLEAKLATQSDDTKYLNMLGKVLRYFIERIGVK